jgi:hypothetical protein
LEIRFVNVLIFKLDLAARKVQTFWVWQTCETQVTWVWQPRKTQASVIIYIHINTQLSLTLHDIYNKIIRKQQKHPCMQPYVWPKLLGFDKHLDPSYLLAWLSDSNDLGLATTPDPRRLGLATMPDPSVWGNLYTYKYPITCNPTWYLQ